jgi:hypothetical protein
MKVAIASAASAAHSGATSVRGLTRMTVFQTPIKAEMSEVDPKKETVG